MTDGYFLGPPRKSSLLGRVAPWLLTIPAAMIGILLVELFCHLFVPSISKAARPLDWDRRIIFFDGDGSIFENHGDIFTYLPNKELRNLTGFLSGDGFAVEYDYHFRTNNFGLVQDTDIAPTRDSLLLLGDSFTEGQGAEPWFRLVSPQIDSLGYQPINGGLLATGFEQWVELERYLAARDVKIQKLVIVFISDDFR